MIVVSGCPRSGTSLMMDIFKHSVGSDGIIGDEFPRDQIVPRVPNELESYVISKIPPKDEAKEAKESAATKDMNPNGFFEMAWSVQGIQYSRQWRHELFKGNRKVAKIVSQGLALSDPYYIDAVVYMLRHPRNVAKSQERLKGHDLPEGHVVHSPKMFIDVTIQAAQYLVDNPNIPVKVVVSDDLQAEPVKVANEIGEFLKLDLSAGAARVDPKLNRSKPEDVTRDDWGRAEAMYEMARVADWQGVIDAHIANKVERDGLYCGRTGRQMSKAECTKCLAGAEAFVANQIKQHGATAEEPCTRLMLRGATAEESKKQNVWGASRGVGDTFSKITKALGIKECNGCNSRKNKLNKLLPWPKK